MNGWTVWAADKPGTQAVGFILKSPVQGLFLLGLSILRNRQATELLLLLLVANLDGPTI